MTRYLTTNNDRSNTDEHGVSPSGWKRLGQFGTWYCVTVTIIAWCPVNTQSTVVRHTPYVSRRSRWQLTLAVTLPIKIIAALGCQGRIHRNSTKTGATSHFVSHPFHSFSCSFFALPSRPLRFCRLPFVPSFSLPWLEAAPLNIVMGLEECCTDWTCLPTTHDPLL